MTNEETLFKIREKSIRYSGRSKKELAYFINNEYPHLHDEFEVWSKNRRMIDPAVFLGESICDLEGILFGDNYWKVSIFAGAAGEISDDLIDNGEFKENNQVSLLTPERYRSPPETKRMELFYAFDKKLGELMPSNFQNNWEKVIRGYNQSQLDSLELFNPSIGGRDIIDIRDRVGGYTLLLLHGLLLPEHLNLNEQVNEKYVPSSYSSKNQVLYNYGAWTNRVDDLWDEQKDKKKNMKQLATEGCIDWKSLQIETKQVFNSLANYYIPERVNKVLINYFSPLIDKSIADKYNQ